MKSFTYPLPPDRIAQRPAQPRSAARLLVATDPGGAVSHATVADLPSLVEPGDLIVLNTTRVMPARLRLRKSTGAAVEVLVLTLEPDGTGTALVRPSRRVPPGTVLLASGEGSGEGVVEDVVEVGHAAGDGQRAIRMLAPLERHGTIPLPPYIAAALDDPERYQTVYADRPGSVAAPTAGLHLTVDVLEACRHTGAEIATVDLDVGLATFKPITTATVEEHPMHAERYAVPAATMAAVERARRVLAVGTTTLRALESAALGSLEGSTDLFIRRPFSFRVVDLLLTNFHMPRSSLLVLLEAFCGPRWRDLYDCAMREGYRFLSFGDAMLVARQ
ncbi:MAG: tRNA preQ1(34) S-adenosylmethionine ribosyltransferase-isomerase QueA [Actinobacteria bacterium]|nr:tRNA preQ1(34) S-adenosylmethionine ribosyltransferase-isomerase QueA [Actinomycetota bacterium]